MFKELPLLDGSPGLCVFIYSKCRTNVLASVVALVFECSSAGSCLCRSELDGLYFWLWA